MWDSVWTWVVVALAVAALVVGGLELARRRHAVPGRPGASRSWRRRPPRDQFRPPDHVPPPERPKKRAGIIVNPTRFADLEALRSRVTDVCTDLGWGEPLWFETTIADPGTGQARQAVHEGAVVVCPLGGDGTVRAVAAGLVGTETPMGLLPGGTGNLLARNLDLPVDSIEKALVIALTGRNTRIDVGRLEVDPSGQHATPDRHLFLVMAGLGFDAEIMAGAPAALKARVGPAAYVMAGMRNLYGPGFKARLEVEDTSPDADDEVRRLSRRTRTVVIGNCGRILGGLELLPAASVDDGLLDTVLLSPRGVVGWAAVAGHVATRNRRGHWLIDRFTGTRVHVSTDDPQQVQVDGDVVGSARAVTATVDRLALVVRVPLSPEPPAGSATRDQGR